MVLHEIKKLLHNKRNEMVSKLKKSPHRMGENICYTSDKG
jgi:hypothetical protein